VAVIYSMGYSPDGMKPIFELRFSPPLFDKVLDEIEVSGLPRFKTSRVVQDESCIILWTIFVVNVSVSRLSVRYLLSERVVSTKKFPR
jgi:hypothetical protein